MCSIVWTIFGMCSSIESIMCVLVYIPVVLMHVNLCPLVCRDTSGTQKLWGYWLSPCRVSTFQKRSCNTSLAAFSFQSVTGDLVQDRPLTCCVSSQAQRQWPLSGQSGDSDAAAVWLCHPEGASYQVWTYRLLEETMQYLLIWLTQDSRINKWMIKLLTINGPSIKGFNRGVFMISAKVEKS